MKSSVSLHEARLRLDRLDYSHYFGSIVKRFGSLEGRRIKELALEPDKRPSVTGDEVRRAG